VRALLVVVALTSSASAENPRDWLVRAAPGVGYAWDDAQTCTMQGRMFVGGFSAAHEVTEGVFVGAGTTIIFNTLLADAPCGLDDGVRLAMGMVFGPSVEIYPDPAQGISLFALAGYAEIDHEQGAMNTPGRGIGGTVGIGWERGGRGTGDVQALFGVRLQLTLARTWGVAVEHAPFAPSIVATFGFD